MKLAKLLVVAALAVSISACGKQNKLVLDAGLKTLTDGTADYVQLKALLDTGNMRVGGEVDIPHPSVPGVSIGTVGLFPTTTPQVSELTLKLNLDETFYGMGADGTTLPNGAPIPVDNLGDAYPVAFKAGKHSRAYLALNDRVAMIGAALVIKEFDGFADRVPYVNVFPTFNLGKVVGTAGVFTSAEQFQSGVAIFVDAGAIFHRDSNVTGRVLSFGAGATDADMTAVGMGLYQLNRKSSTMTLK